MPSPVEDRTDAGVSGPLVLGGELGRLPGVAEDDVPYGQFGREIELLRQRQHPQVAAVRDPAGVRLLRLREQPQQRRLAGAVKPDDADPVTSRPARSRRRSSSGPAVPYALDTRSRLTILAIRRSPVAADGDAVTAPVLPPPGR